MYLIQFYDWTTVIWDFQRMCVCVCVFVCLGFYRFSFQLVSFRFHFIIFCFRVQRLSLSESCWNIYINSTSTSIRSSTKVPSSNILLHKFFLLLISHVSLPQGEMNVTCVCINTTLSLKKTTITKITLNFDSIYSFFCFQTEPNMFLSHGLTHWHHLKI